MASLLQGWWDDPQASASLFIAIVAAMFAIYQLRMIPAERRRRILDTMVEQYASTAPDRGKVLKQLPPLMLGGYQAVAAALEHRITELETIRMGLPAEAAAESHSALNHLYRLRQEAQVCTRPDVGISYTAADEVLDSEVKLRALLWAIERVRGAAGSEDEFGQAIAAAKKAVNALNNFALDYENGAYPARTLLGQLHRSIAPIAKALEPVIWERSIEGRWGRRILRLGLAAQHFNDVTRIHRSTDLRWDASSEGQPLTVVLHPARTDDIFGKEVPNGYLPKPYATKSMWRLHARAAYWSAVSKISPLPRYWFVAYGGVRLRRHLGSEDTLAGCLRFITRQSARQGTAASTDFSWNLAGVRREMDEYARRLRKAAQSGSGGVVSADGSA